MIHEQVRSAYKRSGMSLAEIANTSGVSENTVLNVFRGRNVTVGNLIAVAQTVGLSALDLGDQSGQSDVNRRVGD